MAVWLDNMLLRQNPLGIQTVSQNHSETTAYCALMTPLNLLILQRQGTGKLVKQLFDNNNHIPCFTAYLQIPQLQPK